MECDSAKKKNEILPSATTWVDLEGIVLSEISQTEKDKYDDFTQMWNLKKQSKQTKQNKLIDTKNILMAGLPDRREIGESERGKGIKMCKLPDIKSRGDVKCSTGNITSNIVIAMDGVRWALLPKLQKCLYVYNIVCQH